MGVEQVNMVKWKGRTGEGGTDGKGEWKKTTEAQGRRRKADDG